MSSIDITLVITNWNGASLLRECLPSILRAVQFDSKRSYEIMVIDDCSSDDSLQILEQEFPQVRRERTPRNLGFQGANNYAVELANSPLVFPMNNDVKLHEESLFHLAEHFFEKNDDGLLFAVSGKFYGFDETTFLYGNRGGRFHEGHFFLYEKPAEDTSQTLFACGAGFLVNRQRYLELGGFDSLYHPLYYEEIDMSYRALKRGWRVEYEPRSIAYHKVQATITQQEKRKQIGYISGRNNYLFLWKNILDRGMTAAFLVYTPLYLLRDLCRFKFRFWICFYMALKRIGPALEGRRKEREARLPVSDKEALQRINAQSPTAPKP
ncbi:MAG: glycosyltransferase family 2 protein [Candidatus Nitrohelix vancouverensis]|uniref:Glycosyltransferase family 2 protein n=1 Tax=Candidatus Nitrohelix vancouverensis TaxID=2705534 RepID=A0A7T0C4F1_9BACT|nr:MAG: glycosyltransferase family 2 protein [Candidatus Nitrohelix vancouverensis]